MRSRLSPLFHSLVTSLIVVSTTIGCEYEYRDDPVASTRSNQPPPPTEEEVKAQEVRKQVAASGERPTLKAGKDVSGAMAIPANAKKLNLPQLAEAGQLAVTSNVPGLGDLQNVYDEGDSTLTKSDGVNPFRFTLDFTTTRNIKAVRVLSTYSDYGWAIQSDSGQRFVVDMVIDGEWSTVAFPEGLKTKQLIVEVLRKVRDNYVHVNEIEVYE
jgi:hypothetical protein